MSRFQTFACAALMGASLAAWALSPVVLDDAFISYRYARNLVEGHGLVFNPGERVEGYTNFLWVMISAAVIRVGLEPLTPLRTLGLVSYIACVGLAVITASRIAQQVRPTRLLAATLLVGVLAVTRDVAPLAGSGLETFFVSVCLVGMGVTFHFLRPSPRQEIAFSLIPALAALTRLDASLGVAASAIATVVCTHRGALVPTLIRRYGLAIISIGLLAVWRYAYYGALLPNSFHAKGAAGWYVVPGMYYLGGYVLNSPSVLILSALAAYGWRATWRTEWRGWQTYLVGFVLVHSAYVVKVGGDFMYYRLMFEALPLLVCAASVGLVCLTAQRETVPLIVAISSLLLSVTPRYLEESYAMQSAREMDRYARAGQEVGTRLKDVLPSDTVIATTLAGTVPYFSRLETVDQWGLNDRFVAALPEPKKFVRGHLKSAPPGYLVDRGVNLVINHPTVTSCENLTNDPAPQIAVRLSGSRCLRTFYLVQQPELTQYFCSRPDYFVLRNVACFSLATAHTAVRQK